jgi:hypothetical protein
MAPPAPATAVRVKKKPGPTPKPLTERAIRRKELVKTPQRSYSRAKKLEIITYLASTMVSNEQSTYQKAHHVMRKDAPKRYTDKNGAAWRPVTMQETGEFFKIPCQRMSDWWKNRENILKPVKRKTAARRSAPEARAQQVSWADKLAAVQVPPTENPAGARIPSTETSAS